MRPDPNSPFRWAYQLSAIALVGFSVLSWSDVPWWTFGVCVTLGVLWLARVPRRLRLIEIAIAFAALCAWGAVPGDGVLPVAVGVLVAACVASLSLLAPEAGLARLNGMDHFLLAQDYPDMAMNSHHLIDTDRQLDPASLERAVDSLMVDVPLLRSFVREATFNAERFYTAKPWRTAAELIRYETDLHADERLLTQPFDLHREPAWRLLVHPREEGGWRTVISVHHSICDGTAQVILFDALMKRYIAFLSGSPTEPVPHLARPLPGFYELLRHHGLAWLWSMVKRHVRPADKVGVKNASLLEDEEAVPTAIHRTLITLPRSEMAPLWEAAKCYRATLNHLYLAAALRAADAWRVARGKPERKFRVLTPVDLRPILKLKPCLGNYSGIINLDLTPEEIRGDGLLAAIKVRLKEGRQLENAIEAPINLGVVSSVLPLGHFRNILREFDSSNESFFFSFGFTAVMFPSELAIPTDVEVERMWMLGSPPRHPGVGVGPVRDRNRVYLIAAYRVPLLTDDGAADFLARFKSELDRLVATAPERKRRKRVES